jgi:hypothetical protein
MKQLIEQNKKKQEVLERNFLLLSFHVTTDCIANDVSNNSSIAACAFVAGVTFYRAVA